MADTCAGGDNAEVFKGTLAPFQELVALHVLFVFALHVCRESVGIAKIVNNN